MSSPNQASAKCDSGRKPSFTGAREAIRKLSFGKLRSPKGEAKSGEPPETVADPFLTWGEDDQPPSTSGDSTPPDVPSIPPHMSESLSKLEAASSRRSDDLSSAQEEELRRKVDEFKKKLGGHVLRSPDLSAQEFTVQASTTSTNGSPELSPAALRRKVIIMPTDSTKSKSTKTDSGSV